MYACAYVCVYVTLYAHTAVKKLAVAVPVPEVLDLEAFRSSGEPIYMYYMCARVCTCVYMCVCT